MLLIFCFQAEAKKSPEVNTTLGALEDLILLCQDVLFDNDGAEVKLFTDENNPEKSCSCCNRYGIWSCTTTECKFHNKKVKLDVSKKNQDVH